MILQICNAEIHIEHTADSEQDRKQKYGLQIYLYIDRHSDVKNNNINEVEGVAQLG